jgi:hypothetical protein
VVAGVVAGAAGAFCAGDAAGCVAGTGRPDSVEADAANGVASDPMIVSAAVARTMSEVDAPRTWPVRQGSDASGWTRSRTRLLKKERF